ncbi:MAG: DUF2510 domain-containing protein [Mycobacterium sp.]|nr:DUF2510 domain-containing protein [Mycobacterium sp.]
MVILGVVVAFIASHASHYFRDRPYRWTAEAVGIAAVLRLVIVALLWHHLTVNVEDAPTFGEVIPDVLIGFAIYLPFALAGTYIGRRNHDRFIAKKLAQAEAKAKHTATYTASFTATTPQGPPAGWYNDPDGLLNIERYWDGTAWTDQRRNAASSSP